MASMVAVRRLSPLQMLALWLRLSLSSGARSIQHLEALSSPLTSGRLAFTLNPTDQTIKTLGLAGATDGFSFTGDGTVSLGDASIRVRVAGTAAEAASSARWSSFVTKGAQPIPSGSCPKLPCRAMLNFTQLDSAATSTAPPFSILREWENGPNSTLRLAFKVTNTGAQPLEIGGLGLAMPFAWAAGSDAGDAASTFADPAITGEHGYVTVTRLSGKAEVLMITTGVDAARCDANKSGCRTSLEAWDVAKPSGDGGHNMAVASGHRVAGQGPDNGAREWLCHTKAYAEDWSNASKAWLQPTSMVLSAG